MRKTSPTTEPLPAESTSSSASRASEPAPAASSGPARKHPANDALSDASSGVRDSAPDGARPRAPRRGKKKAPVVVVKPGIVLWNALSLEEIGVSVRLKRKALDYTLDDLERLTGVSKRTLIKLEAGGDVRYSTLLKVLSAVGLVLAFNGPSLEDLRKILNGTFSTNPEDSLEWF